VNRNQLNSIATPTPERFDIMRFSEMRCAKSLGDIVRKNGVEFSTGIIYREEIPLWPGPVKSKQKINKAYNKMGSHKGTRPPVVPCPLVMEYRLDFMKKCPLLS
jgi:hypothetical protein